MYYNLSYLNDADGIRLYNKIKETHVYNNVSYDNGSEGISVWGDGTGGSIENNLIKNNIATENDGCELRCGYGGENDGTNGSGNVYTYNCFGAESSNFIEWGDSNYDSTYDDWETSYGGTTHSVEAAPLMTNPGNGDFTLQVGSPCRERGTNVALTADYDGSYVPQGLVDIGAYEYASPVALFFGINF